MAKPDRKWQSVGTEGAWFIVDGRRVRITGVEVSTGTFHIAPGHDTAAALVALYNPPIEYTDPYPEEHE